MVKRVARRAALAAGLLCLPLTSCPFLLQTPFPAMLTLVEEAVDLSAYIPAANDKCSDCVELNLFNGRLFVTVMGPTAGVLVVLDTELQVLQANVGDYAGRFAAFDGSTYYIGGESLGLGLEYLGKNSYSNGNRGCAVGSEVLYFWSDGIYLQCNGTASWSKPIGLDWHFEDVQADAANAYLFFSTGDWNQNRLVTVPASQMTSGPLADVATYPGIDLTGADRSEVHLLQDGWVVLRHNGTYQRYDRTTGALLDSLPGGLGSKYYADAFDPAGFWFYYYDGGAKRIYKCRTWWP